MSDLEKPMPEPSFVPNIFPAYFVTGCDLASIKKPKEHKSDCYFYSEEQDMHASIPCCGYHHYFYEEFDCCGCHAYVPNKSVFTLIKSLVNNGEFDKIKEEK